MRALLTLMLGTGSPALVICAFLAMIGVIRSAKIGKVTAIRNAEIGKETQITEAEIQRDAQIAVAKIQRDAQIAVAKIQRDAQIAVAKIQTEVEVRAATVCEPPAPDWFAEPPSVEATMDMQRREADLLARIDDLTSRLAATRVGQETQPQIGTAQGRRPDVTGLDMKVSWTDANSASAADDRDRRKIEMPMFVFDWHKRDDKAETESQLAEFDRTPLNAPCPCDSGRKYKHCHAEYARNLRRGRAAHSLASSPQS